MTWESPRGALPKRGISIRVAGDPAHGLLFAGYLLAELRIAGDPDEYPLVDAPECLLLTSAAALERFGPDLAPEGQLLVEESLRGQAPAFAVALPLIQAAIESGGTSLVLDLVASAVVTATTGAVSRRALYEAAGRLLPERGRPAAFAALDAGMEIGRSRFRV